MTSKTMLRFFHTLCMLAVLASADPIITPCPPSQAAITALCGVHATACHYSDSNLVCICKSSPLTGSLLQADGIWRCDANCGNVFPCTPAESLAYCGSPSLVSACTITPAFGGPTGATPPFVTCTCPNPADCPGTRRPCGVETADRCGYQPSAISCDIVTGFHAATVPYMGYFCDCNGTTSANSRCPNSRYPCAYDTGYRCGNYPDFPQTCWITTPPVGSPLIDPYECKCHDGQTVTDKRCPGQAYVASLSGGFFG